MRPVKQRFDPGRSGRERKVVSKYIIVTEGYRTEQKYFEAICEDRRITGISGLVEVVVLQRERIDSGLSHPLTLLDLLDEYMRCVRCRRYSYKLLLEVTTDSLAIASDITRNSEAMDEFRRTVESGTKGFVDEDGFVDNVPGFVRTCSDTSKTMFGIPLNIVPPELIDFRPETDHVCVVVDRDRDDRNAKAMDEFVRRCRREGYRPYISNPCFEIWLMMHFEAFDAVDREMLLRNPMIDGTRFTEKELDSILKGINPEYRYDKTDPRPEMFMHRIGEAITRSMGMCHDPLRLKSEIGTNLGELLREMRSRRK